MFFDHVRIDVSAGRGGDGCVSFRREAHVPKGGPDGGDGGRGGDVVLICSRSIRDLAGFRGRKNFSAEAGRPGEGSQRQGKAGDDCELMVPPGTSIETADGELSAELTYHGQRLIAARGGSPGRGNKQFATSTQQTPRFSERGLEGEEVELDLRLRLLADAGLIGLPNAGKSSLLARMTRAQPKVANYPFTTLEPVLGTLESDERQLVMVDIPGLIEGASEGAGLGHEFLAHVERCRLLVHVVDVEPIDGSDQFENFATVESEIERHSRALVALPRIVALSKIDLMLPEDVEVAVELWREHLGDRVLDVVPTSSATGAGLDVLRGAVFQHVPVDLGEAVVTGAGVVDDETIDPGHRTYRPGSGEGFRVERVSDDEFVVHGRGIEILAARFDLANDEAMRHLEKRLRVIGVIRELDRAGFSPGDTLTIGEQSFELDA